MARVLLDTQVWNYMVDDESARGTGVTASSLSAAADRHEVVGSFDLLQELMGVMTSDPAKYRQIVDTFFNLVGPRLLIPLRERNLTESVAGGILSEQQRYANRRLRRDAKTAARRRRTVLSVADQTYLDGVEFKSEEEALREKALTDLRDAGESTKYKRLVQWYEDVDIDSWVMDVVEGGTGATEIRDFGPDRFPSVWTFIACRLARLPAVLGERRRIQESDLRDAHHVACGPYVDVIVTNDKELERTIDLMATRPLPFRYVGLERFVAM